MIVGIHQPQYLPWLGYLDKIDISDVFVILDNVQYKKNEWQNRNRIKTAQGCQWITVPVLYRFPQRINEVQIANREGWTRKHLNTLITNYRKAPYFGDHLPFFEETYGRTWEYLVDINVHLIRYLIDALGIETELVLASQLNLRDGSTERLVDICKAVNADTYLSGRDGSQYMDLTQFRAEGIEVLFQNFHHPVYNQLYGEFEPNMSAVDLLFNNNTQSLELIRRERYEHTCFGSSSR
jgi:hypothetical protein